ncbi:MAG: hypothetical protein JO244_06245 [Solirubrobacterales bacterium]|nr:hypothetical protein [Solirubrobacterales bacterium]
MPRSPHPRPSPLAAAERTHEYPAARAPVQRAAGGSTSAIAAVTAFAAAYINWNAQDVSQDLHDLAARSLGQARSALQLAAAQTASDYELQRGGIANQGTVEAVAPLTAGGDRYVVVTSELTTATATTAYQGLQPAWHVAIATVTEQGDGRWVVSGWQPES